MANSRFAVMLLLALAGCGVNDADMSIPIDDAVTPADVPAVQAGVATLMNACPGLARYWRDLNVGGAGVHPASLTDQRERGWHKVIHVEIAIAGRPALIPSEYMAQGHRCYFDAGIAPPRGVAVAKRACQSVCLDAQIKTAKDFIPARAR